MATKTEMVRESTVPSYTQVFQDVYETCEENYQTFSWNLSRYPLQFKEDLLRYTYVSSGEIMLVIITAVLLTFARFLLTKLVYRPVGRYLQVQEENVVQYKLPESIWKLSFYASSWFYCYYLLFVSGKYDFFQKPLLIWKDRAINDSLNLGSNTEMSVPPDIAVIYCVELAYYLHAVYATFYMDWWRKDSYVMVFHHVLTMSLISFSYASRYHEIGLLVLFLHDVADICLEFTKCNVYIKNRGGKLHQINDHISTVGFLCFATSWAVFRLYWMPLKVLHSVSYGVLTYATDRYVPFQFFFNVLLWILQILNVYWFMFIVQFLYRVATGQMKEVDDVREEEVLDRIRKQNGVTQLQQTQQTNGTNGTNIHHDKQNGGIDTKKRA